MFDQTQQDLKDFHRLMSNFWKRVPDDVWDTRTGNREKDWTLHQTLAHVLSIAQAFNKAADAALRNEAFHLRGFTERDQLANWNEGEIERLTKVPPNGLIVQFLQEIRIAHDKVATITEDIVGRTVQVPIYNRPARAIDYLRWQLSHAGIIHGAQVIVPLNRAPLWTDFEAEFTHRVLGYYLQQWSMAYWQDMGSDNAKSINFHISGEGGGDWHIIAAPDGGSSDSGIIEGADYELFFESPHVLFSVFSNHISIRSAMVNGRMRLASDVRDTLAILSLFSPKRPTIEE